MCCRITVLLFKALKRLSTISTEIFVWMFVCFYEMLFLSFTDLNSCWDTCKAQYWSKLEEYLRSTAVSFQIQPFCRTARATAVTLKSDSLVSFRIIRNNSGELKDKATFCNRFCSSSANVRLRESISNQMFHERSFICCLFLSTLC